MIRDASMDEVLYDEAMEYLLKESRYPKRKELAKILKKVWRYGNIIGFRPVNVDIAREDYLSYGDYFSVTTTSNDHILESVLQGFGETSEVELIALGISYNTYSKEYFYFNSDFYKVKY